MLLEYNGSQKRWFVRVPRGDTKLADTLQRRHGFDFYIGPSETVYHTNEPFAAVTFFEHATPEARAPLSAINIQIGESWKENSLKQYRVPPELELWPFQKANLDYALQRRHCLIGDQPGLGKTPTAICFANEIRAKRILAIVPASVRLQWAVRIQDWFLAADGGSAYSHVILNSKNGTHPTAAWTIASYEMATHEVIGASLAAERWDLLILDEAHYLKTIDARRTRAVFGGGEDRSFPPIAANAERILALTGTPLPNRSREAYVLARHMCWDSIDWMSAEAFKTRFNPSVRRETPDGEIFIDERSGREYELGNRLRANFMIRHEKHGPRGVMKQLKMPNFQLVQLEGNSVAVKAALKAERLLGFDPEKMEGANMAIPGHVAVVRHQMGLAMAPLIVDLVHGWMDGGEDKLVIFAHHIDVLDIFHREFQKYGVLRIDGRTSSRAKYNICQEFIRDPRKQIIVGQIQSMGTGVDGLQFICNHGLLAEPDWVHGNNEQVFARLDRGGQEWQVQADIAVIPGSFAERVLATSLRKGRTTESVLDHHGGVTL